MGFSYLDNLFWFLGIPLGFLLVFLIYRRGGWALSMFFNKEDYKNGNALSKTILRLAGLCFAFIAILGPYWGKTDQNVFLLGREIYIVLDISASMNADDLKPTRLDKCKREILNLIETLKGDQIGLIVFASQAYVQCPITRDYRALSMFLELAESDQFAQSGTDIRNGLLMALDRFTNTEKRSDRMSRAVILLTDGEDFGEGYRSVLDRLKRNNIQVFVVGVGTKEGAPVPELANGKVRGHKHRPDGSIVNSKVNQEELEKLATFLGVPYYSLENPSSNLQGLAQSVKNIASSPLSARIEKVENSKFYVFACLALLCWSISLFLMPITLVNILKN